MNPELLELLSRINDLSSEELDALDASLVAEFDRLDVPAEERTAETAAGMEAAADALTRVRETQATRIQEAADLEARTADLRRQIHAVDDDGEGAANPEAEGGDAEVVEPEVVEPEVETPVAVAASTRPVPPRPSLGAMNARRSAAAQRGPTATAPAGDEGDPGRGRQTVFARRAIPDANIGNGDRITNLDQIHQGMFDAIKRLGVGGDEVLVASSVIEYPPDRRLTGDMVTDNRMIDAVVRGPETALVASGGICNPVNVDYTIQVLADDSEPVKDSLPSFQASRGGLRFVTPPTLASVGRAGTAMWTAATDAGAPGNSATKPYQTFVCGSEVEVLVDAIPTRLRFGNMMARFSPEIVAANTELALANAARFREEHRLTTIASYSTLVSSSQLLGASRDFMATVDQAASAYRYRQRMARNATLRAILPSFLIDMFRADLTREMANSADGVVSPVTDAQINQWFSIRNIAVTWIMDDLPVQAGSIVWPYQGFGTQAANNVLLGWPTAVSWFLFAEGTFQFLDGGTLNLGVVRDSTLNNTNDYETFIEVFEAIAKRGVESLQIVSFVRPNGLSAGNINTSTY